MYKFIYVANHKAKVSGEWLVVDATTGDVQSAWKTQAEAARVAKDLNNSYDKFRKRSISSLKK